MRTKKLNVKEKSSDHGGCGVIQFIFQTISQWLFLKLASGIFGRFFTSYDQEEECFENSVVGFVSGAHHGKKSSMISYS